MHLNTKIIGNIKKILLKIIKINEIQAAKCQSEKKLTMFSYVKNIKHWKICPMALLLARLHSDDKHNYWQWIQHWRLLTSEGMYRQDWRKLKMVRFVLILCHFFNTSVYFTCRYFAFFYLVAWRWFISIFTSIII